MVTIQEVASTAGVSVATVSRVLNNSPLVTDRTRQKVMEAIKTLNYQPNLLGRNLRRMETRMILVLLPNISNPFYSRIVKGIEDIGHKNGYNVMLCNTDNDKGRERVYIELLRNRLSDGVIFMASQLGRDELSKIGLSYPVVQCCEYTEGAGVSHVSIDNTAAAEKVVNHLISLGHSRIAIISCKNSFVSTVRREEGYSSALRKAGIEICSDYIVYGDYSYKSGLRAAKSLLELKERPTAIFAISDLMAAGALKVVKESGLKVPDDVAVAGFDNISYASMFDPMLTTISQPKYDLGCTAMELLLKHIKKEITEMQSITLEHELIIRESTLKQ